MHLLVDVPHGSRASEPGGGVQIHIFWGMGGVGILGYGGGGGIPAITSGARPPLFKNMFCKYGSAVCALLFRSMFCKYGGVGPFI